MRRLFTLGTLLAVVVALAALSEVKSGEPPVASAGPTGDAIWGDWDCSGVAAAAEPQGDIEDIGPGDFFEVMYFLGGLQTALTGCTSIGEAVTVALFGTLIWGDINCDGVVNAIDALLWMLWYAGVIPDEFPDCPTVGEVLDLIEGLADFKAEAMSYQIVGPVARTAPQDAEPQFFDIPYFVDTAFIIHNNGPNSPIPNLYWDLELLSGGMFFRWMAMPGDICLDVDDNEIPCGEGGGIAAAGNGDDNCYDEVDNDSDQLVDFADPDCREVRRLLTSADQITVAGGPFPPSVSQAVHRNFNVRCLQPGTYNFAIAGRIDVDTNYVDPELNNNIATTSVSQPPCVITKQPSGGAASSGEAALSGPPPFPYEPAALPQTGGRPD